MIKFKLLTVNKKLIHNIANLSKVVHGINHINSNTKHLTKKHFSIKNNASKVLLGYHKDFLACVLFLLKKNTSFLKSSYIYYLCDLMIHHKFRRGMLTLDKVMNNRVFKNIKRPVIHTSSNKTDYIYKKIFNYKIIKTYKTFTISSKKILKNNKILKLFKDRNKISKNLVINLNKYEEFKKKLENIYNRKNILYIDNKNYFDQYVKNNSSYLFLDLKFSRKNFGYFILNRFKSNIYIICDFKFNFEIKIKQLILVIYEIIFFLKTKYNFVIMEDNKKIFNFCVKNNLSISLCNYNFSYPVFLRNLTTSNINLIKKTNFAFCDFDAYYIY